MSKKLVINCATCDARNVSEETLSSYESININAASDHFLRIPLFSISIM